VLARIALHPADIQAAAPIRRGIVDPRAGARAAPRRMLDIEDCLAALRVGGGEALRHWLTRGLARMGLAAFVTEGVAPLTTDVGDAWVAGGLAVYEEHLYSEAIQTVLRNGMLPFQAGLERSVPRVLLTTVPGEQHGLGLLMAEALLTLEACCCLPLGVQTPIADIVAASRAHRIDVVAVSFSESLATPDVLAALVELRARLPAPVRIWAGGGAPVLRELTLHGIQVLPGLVDIVEAVADWRKDSSATVD
jgi:methanogenic corrinoid protein MtbC1